MAYVYRHIREDKNVPFYIGVGTDKNYKRAFTEKGRTDSWKAIIKVTAYEVEVIIDNLSFEEAQQKEREFIALYGKMSKGGLLCNKRDGGDPCPFGKPSPKKGIKIEMRGEKHPMFGKTHSDELKQRWQISRKGVVPWNKGVTLENKESHAMVLFNKAKSIRVYQYDLNNNFINSYDSLNEAFHKTGIGKGNISHCLKGNRKSSGGYLWTNTPPE